MKIPALWPVLAGLALLIAVPAFAQSLPSNVKTEKTTLGEVYANAKGMTLYEFKNDVPNSGKAACVAACAKLWPPMPVPAGFSPMGPWGTATGAGGVKQLTYEGYPLYTWVKDMKPGDVTGQGVKGNWRAAVPGSKQMPW